jgi:hypothetical protein
MLTPGVTPATLMRTIAEGANSPIRERLDVIVRTEAEWRALIDRVSLGKRAEGVVDFDHEMVVGVFVGPHPSTGYRAEVFNVARKGGNIVVWYRVHPPANVSREAPTETAPYHLVVVPRDQRRITFVEVREVGSH